MILGIFGSPEVIWNRGESLGDYNINAVFISHKNLGEDVVDRIHREGARVFVEIGIFVGKDTVEKYPELAPIGVDGKPLTPIKWYMGINPAIDWYRDKKSNEIRETLQNYNIDGLWLDFIRYPCHWEVPNPKLEQSSFDEGSIKKFEKYIGTVIPGTAIQDKARWILNEKLEDWTKWKCEQITSFCRDARKIIKDINPKAILGIFSVPWREDQFGGAILKIIAQDFKALSQYVDIFSPMVYHLMCGFPVSWIKDYSLYLRNKTGKLVVPIVQAVDEPSKVDNLEDVIRISLDANPDGVIVFTAQAIFEDEIKIEALRRCFLSVKEK
ncbi:MAG: putative glycoside hydrolase [bacterium]|nr:putative glycoside hydrolase [bacterium]